MVYIERGVVWYYIYRPKDIEKNNLSVLRNEPFTNVLWACNYVSHTHANLDTKIAHNIHDLEQLAIMPGKYVIFM